MIPKAQMSTACVYMTPLLTINSGAAYPTVPVQVIGLDKDTIPKSANLTCIGSKDATRMLAGLISRCVIPLECAVSSASAS